MRGNILLLEVMDTCFITKHSFLCFISCFIPILILFILFILNNRKRRNQIWPTRMYTPKIFQRQGDRFYYISKTFQYNLNRQSKNISHKPIV